MLDSNKNGLGFIFFYFFYFLEKQNGLVLRLITYPRIKSFSSLYEGKTISLVPKPCAKV